MYGVLPAATLMYPQPSDWHDNTGIIRQADEQGMGIILMRFLTSGVFQGVMAGPAPCERDADSRVGAGGGRLLLRTVLSDLCADVALVRGRAPRPREPRFAVLNDGISNDVASRIDLAKLHDRYVS